MISQLLLFAPAGALQAAVDDTPLQYRIIIGEAKSEIALELTAYGIDPGAFLRMQQFLPKLGLDGQPEWNTRQYGHIGNWRKDIVVFCLVTAIDLVRKIQYADYQPSPVPFSFLFDDVITAKRDRVLVSSSQAYSGLYGIGGTEIAVLRVYEQGRLHQGRTDSGFSVRFRQMGGG